MYDSVTLGSRLGYFRPPHSSWALTPCDRIMNLWGIALILMCLFLFISNFESPWGIPWAPVPDNINGIAGLSQRFASLFLFYLPDGIGMLTWAFNPHCCGLYTSFVHANSTNKIINLKRHSPSANTTKHNPLWKKEKIQVTSNYLGCKCSRNFLAISGVACN